MMDLAIIDWNFGLILPNFMHYQLERFRDHLYVESIQLYGFAFISANVFSSQIKPDIRCQTFGDPP